MDILFMFRSNFLFNIFEDNPIPYHDSQIFDTPKDSSKGMHMYILIFIDDEEDES